MKIRVRDLIGGYGITLDDGQRLYDAMHPELAAGRPVEIDFEGVEIYASPFFNAAFGQLLSDLASDDLNRLLIVHGLSAEGAHVLRRVIQNSKRYYSDEQVRRAQDEVLANQARG